MIIEDLIVELDKRLHKIAPRIETRWTQTSKGESKYSREIIGPINKTKSEILCETFDIKSNKWDKLFLQATNGKGQEYNRILTLHSSALIAILCFHNVCENPISIDDEIYNQCWFEVRNSVYGSASSVDVVLKSESGNLLFLESKFTEYLSPDVPEIKMAYWEFYKNILPQIPDYPLQMVYPKVWKKNGEENVGFTIQAKSPKVAYNSLYLAGIKQCFSHIIGISRGPENIEDDCWKNVTPHTKLRFGCIVYRFPTVFTNYNSFYKETIGKISSEMILNSLDGEKTYANQLEIFPELLTYQDIFKKQNPQALLPKVAEYYGLE